MVTFWDKKKIQVVNTFSREVVCEITPEEIKPSKGYETVLVDMEEREEKNADFSRF